MEVSGPGSLTIEKPADCTLYTEAPAGFSRLIRFTKGRIMITAILAGAQLDGVHIVVFLKDGSHMEVVVTWEQLFMSMKVLMDDD